MRYKDKYKCPSCGQVIFDRWFTKCERCHQDLPEELLYSPEEKEQLRVAAQRSRARSDRVFGALTIVWFAGIWIGGIVGTVFYPRDALSILGVCFVITAYRAARMWLASRDDGLNPHLRKTEPNPESSVSAQPDTGHLNKSLETTHGK